MTLTINQALTILQDKTDMRPLLLRAFYEYSPRFESYKVTFWADRRLPMLTYTKGPEKILATHLAITTNGEKWSKVLVELGAEWFDRQYIYVKEA